MDFDSGGTFDPTIALGHARWGQVHRHEVRHRYSISKGLSRFGGLGRATSTHLSKVANLFTVVAGHTVSRALPPTTGVRVATTPWTNDELDYAFVSYECYKVWFRMSSPQSLPSVSWQLPGHDTL